MTTEETIKRLEKIIAQYKRGMITCDEFANLLVRIAVKNGEEE